MLNRQAVRTTINDNYPVVCGKDILPEIRNFVRNQEYSKAMIVADRNVYEKQTGFVHQVQSLFKDAHSITVKPGEESKNLSSWSRIVAWCLEKGVDRNTPLVAIGGGVIGDLAGFAASTVLRGIPLIHIPSSLLAMVDSSIGGKTGVNHSTGKNLIGTFYQPVAVFGDMKLLDTLPEEEFINGFAEVLKYGAISDPVILDILKDRNIPELKGNYDHLEGIIQRCIKIKVSIVSKDTREASDRAFLNYGHTFGHALEKHLGYGTISHGQAVYTGMLAAGYLSEALGGNMNHNLIHQHGLTMDVPDQVLDVTTQELTAAMGHDKKRQGNKLRFVLLQQYGRPYLQEMPEMDTLNECWEKTLQKLKEIKTR